MIAAIYARKSSAHSDKRTMIAPITRMSSVTFRMSHGKPFRWRESMYPKTNSDRTTVIAPIIRMSIASRMLYGKPWRWRRSIDPVNHAITASDSPARDWRRRRVGRG